MHGTEDKDSITTHDLTLVVCLVILTDFWHGHRSLGIVDGGIGLEENRWERRWLPAWDFSDLNDFSMARSNGRLYQITLTMLGIVETDTSQNWYLRRSKG